MMQEIAFNPGGAYVAAVYLSLGPVIILIIAYFVRKSGRATDRWGVTKRYWFLPIGIPLVLYYGIIYWWLFYDQFYRIVIHDGITWELEYKIPTRIKAISGNDISAIRSVTGDMRTYRSARILILTKDGKRYLSSQISKRDTEYYLKILKRYLENFMVQKS